MQLVEMSSNCLILEQGLRGNPMICNDVVHRTASLLHVARFVLSLSGGQTARLIDSFLIRRVRVDTDRCQLSSTLFHASHIASDEITIVFMSRAVQF